LTFFCGKKNSTAATFRHSFSVAERLLSVAEVSRSTKNVISMRKLFLALAFFGLSIGAINAQTYSTDSGSNNDSVQNTNDVQKIVYMSMPYASLETLTVDNTSVPSFNGQTITLPVLNININGIIGQNPENQDSYEYVQAGYYGYINPNIPPSDAPPAPGLNENRVLNLRDGYLNGFKTRIIDGSLKSKRYTIALTPDSAPAVNKAPVQRSATIPTTDAVLYKTPAGERQPVSTTVEKAAHFKWDGLLTDQNFIIGGQPQPNKSISGLTVALYFVNSLTPTLYDQLVQINPTFGNLLNFAPSLISFDTSIPGKETFTTLFPFPVTDAMVVYIKEYPGSPGVPPSQQWKLLGMDGISVRGPNPDLSNFVYYAFPPEMYLPGQYPAVKVITTVTPAAIILTDTAWPGILKNDPAFGPKDSAVKKDPSDQTKYILSDNPVTTLSMSTYNLDPGFYSRVIIWRRGYKTDDGSIKSVGYANNVQNADVFIVVDSVTIDQRIDDPNVSVTNPSADGKPYAYSSGTCQVTIKNAQNFIDGNITIYGIDGKLAENIVRITSDEQTIKCNSGTYIIKIEKQGQKTYTQKIIVK